MRPTLREDTNDHGIHDSDKNTLVNVKIENTYTSTDTPYVYSTLYYDDLPKSPNYTSILGSSQFEDVSCGCLSLMMKSNNIL